MFEEFIFLTKTKEDVYVLEDEVEMLLNAVYEGHGHDLENFVRENVRAHFAQYYIALIKGSANKEKDLKHLKELVAQLEEFKLTLAFSPSQGFIDRVYDYISKEAGHTLVLDISIDAKMIGGVEISYKGEYRDFTLTKYFKEEFRLNKQKILKMLIYGEKIGNENGNII